MPGFWVRVRIYKIVNLVNGKVYIGQTYRTLAQRWAEHRKSGSCCRYLRFAIEKHGPEVFDIEQLASCASKGDADFVEQLLIAEYGSANEDRGYNLTLGGEGSRTRFCANRHDKDATGRTSQGACLICTRRARSDWKKKNPEQVREECRKRSVARRAQDPEKARAADRKWREENRAHRSRYAKNWYFRKKLKTIFQDFDMAVFSKTR